MFEIRPGRESDKPQILLLIKKVYGVEVAERAERRWHWQWYEDPRLTEPGFHGVVAEWNGQVIACVSSVPAGLYFYGMPVNAFWFVDGLVHWSSVRRALRSQKGAKVSSLGTPDLSKGLYAAMLNHPAAGVMQMGKHLTDPAAVVCYKIGSSAQPGTGSWSRLISFQQPLEGVVGNPLALALGWLADLAVPRIPKATLPVNVHEGCFDERFDELWNQAKDDYQAITRRDSVTLNWRYRQHPDTVYTVLTVANKHALLGYLVYSCFYRHQQYRAHIVDLLVPRQHYPALDDLLITAMRRMRAECVHRVECYAGNSQVISALKRMKFKERLHNGKPQSTLVRGLPEVELYITRGDGDGG